MSIKTISLLAEAFAVAIAQAAPFVISDFVDVSVTHGGWKTDAATRVDVTVAQSGGDRICKLDIGAPAAGSHTVSASALPIG